LCKENDHNICIRAGDLKNDKIYLLEVKMPCSNCGRRGHNRKTCSFGDRLYEDLTSYQQERHDLRKALGREEDNLQSIYQNILNENPHLAQPIHFDSPIQIFVNKEALENVEKLIPFWEPRGMQDWDHFLLIAQHSDGTVSNFDLPTIRRIGTKAEDININKGKEGVTIRFKGNFSKKKQLQIKRWLLGIADLRNRIGRAIQRP